MFLGCSAANALRVRKRLPLDASKAIVPCHTMGWPFF
jgi:hypothetical protein